MAYRDIRLEFDEHGVAVLTLARPTVLNALAQHSLAEMLHALDRVRDDGARVLVLTGEGRAFCSGADLSEAGDEAPRDLGAGLEAGFNPVLERMVRLPVPVVSCVNGVAAGGGCGYALAADLCIAARSAYFLQPFASIGLVPDVGATWLLPRLAGKARATAMMLLAQRIPAELAEQWGLIYKAVDDDALAAEVRDLALRLARGPTVAYNLMRQGIREAMSLSLTETLAMERDHQRIAGLTADHAEGVAAFTERRAPVFRGC